MNNIKFLIERLKLKHLVYAKNRYRQTLYNFFLGLLLNSFGVDLVTKGLLGTSPIASIPYSLSLIITELSLGNWTIIFGELLNNSISGNIL